MATSNPSSSRRAFHGSCHCGNTKYIAFLSFPPVATASARPNWEPRTEMFIYKCNCSTCHKTGFFHLRLQSSPDDFMLLSPTDPENGDLGDYRCVTENFRWYFCKNCGVRCFTFMGTGETVEIGVDSFGGSEEGDGGRTIKVWRPKKEGWVEGNRKGGNGYLSVNAVTLDHGQEGLDLREWTEKNWIWYMDMKDRKGDDKARLGDPYEGGCY